MYGGKDIEKARTKRGVGRRIWLLAAILLLAVLLAAPTVVRQVRLSIWPVHYGELVEQYAAEYEIDPLSIYSIIHTESRFKPEAESAVGARGLMQITEETFAWIKLKIARDEPVTFDDLYTPEVNIRFGAYYLARCMERYGDLSTAAAAYHSGWGTVDQLLQNPEYAQNEDTLREFPYQQMNLYVYKVNRAFDRYTALYNAREGK